MIDDEARTTSRSSRESHTPLLVYALSIRHLTPIARFFRVRNSVTGASNFKLKSEHIAIESGLLMNI